MKAPFWLREQRDTPEGARLEPIFTLSQTPQGMGLEPIVTQID